MIANDLHIKTQHYYQDLFDSKPQSKQRQKAFELFKTLGFPNARNDVWHYTSLSSILRKKYLYHYQGDNITNQNLLKNNQVKSIIDSVEIDNCYQIILINGQVVKYPTENIESGLDFNRLDKDQDILELKEVTDNVFDALNCAFYNDGIYVKLAPKRQLKKPLQIINIITEEHQGKQSFARHIFDIGSNSECVCYETHICIGDVDALHHQGFQWHLQENAVAKMYSSNHSNLKHNYLSNNYIELAQKAQFENINVELSGHLTRRDTRASLLGERSHADIFGLLLNKNKDHVDHRLSVRHFSSNTTSSQQYKSLLNDRAKGVVTSQVYVSENIKKVDSYQNSQNILLSPNAKIDTKPELEIYSDDVQCAHGATVGDLDKEAIFYLQSRGLSYESAKALLVSSYIDTIIQKASDKNAQTWFKKQLVKKLPMLEQCQELTA